MRYPARQEKYRIRLRKVSGREGHGIAMNKIAYVIDRHQNHHGSANRVDRSQPRCRRLIRLHQATIIHTCPQTSNTKRHADQSKTGYESPALLCLPTRTVDATIVRMPRPTKPRSTARAATKSDSGPRADRPFAPGYGLAEDGKGLLPWSWVAKQMAKCRTFWVATVHPANRPHVMPVWGVWMEDAFHFSTGRKSRKGRNLAANAACTVTNDDGQEAVIVEGSAEEVKDAAALERVAAAYMKKYKMDPRSMGEPIFSVRPRAVFGFYEKTFPKSATRWRF